MHMKKRKTLTKDQKFTILLISSSIINAAILAFTISSLNYMMDVNNSLMMKVFLSIAFFFLTLSSINLMLVYKLYNYNKIAYIKHIVFAVIYLLIAVAFLFVPYEPIPYYILCGTYVLTIFANRLLKIFENKKIFNIVCNTLLSLASLVVAILLFTLIGEAPALLISGLVMTALIIITVSLAHIMVFAFSRIQLGAMIKILRKTYALEVLYGLVVLIFSFSFIFTIFEPAMENYGDALWYSFAIVTTIGFGDISATTTVGRVLSVVLGIYGIIVVALITSVIVNFYNEVKNKGEPKELEKIKEEKEEETSKKKNKTK